MDATDLQNRFEFHPANTDTRRMEHESIRGHCGVLAKVFNDKLPEGREKALAMTKLEEVMFWANAAIARQGSQDVE